ncbi:MAG: metallophosphoesterase [Planctomycetes bacterium]|nr:metallophosphoesterase [Planctomycetota bacterium]
MSTPKISRRASSESHQNRHRFRLARWLGRSWARLHYARRIEPTWLEVNSLEIPIADLPNSLDGFRIVQLSDFHLKRRLDPNYIRQSVELANQCKPHLIALTGDFVHKGFRYVQPIAELLSELRAPLGIFAVLGNHDHSVRNALGVRRHRRLHLEVTLALEAQGIRVLRNEAVTLDHRGARLVLAGVDDLWSRRCDVRKALDAVPAQSPTIVLAHNPRTIELMEGHRCDLMLSGHTHGGQVNLALLGTAMLGRRKRRFRAGLYQHNGKYLYVNKGVGYGIALRYRTRPEVALLSLALPK